MKQVQREIEVASTGERWRKTKDRSEGEEKRNRLSENGKINYGEDGLE